MLSRKKEMKEAIHADYPNMPSEFLDVFLDMYEKDKEWIEDRIKQQKKIHKKVPEPKVQLTLEELDRLTEKFKAENPQAKAWVETGEEFKSNDIIKEDAVHEPQPELSSGGQDAIQEHRSE